MRPPTNGVGVDRPNLRCTPRRRRWDLHRHMPYWHSRVLAPSRRLGAWMRDYEARRGQCGVFVDGRKSMDLNLCIG